MTEVSPVVSAHTGHNNQMIHEVARLYVPDGADVADVTFGKGAFWTATDTARFKLWASDIEPDREEFTKKVKVHKFTAADFTNLPYRSQSKDVVVLDPPYIHSPGNHTTDNRYNNAGTTKGFYHDDIIDLYRRGMVEAVRVLRPTGQVWVKCKDQVQSSIQRWSHIDIFNIATQELGLYARDLFVLVPTSRTPMNRWKVQRHARKVHSYLWVFDISSPKGLRSRN